MKDVTASNLKDPNKIMVDVFTPRGHGDPSEADHNRCTGCSAGLAINSACSDGLAVTSAWCESRDVYHSIAAHCRTGNVP